MEPSEIRRIVVYNRERKLQRTQPWTYRWVTPQHPIMKIYVGRRINPHLFQVVRGTLVPAKFREGMNRYRLPPVWLQEYAKAHAADLLQGAEVIE